ncbi:MAG: hypothetical protein HY796_10475 [Elusimicrobia bacterium]|nr:hypothetical protein [Elusimicrobiota bacterium]
MTPELRRLVYVPILHVREDFDELVAMSRGNEAKEREPQPMEERRAAINEMWSGIAARIEELGLPWEQTRIYQDGLPVCGTELKIAAQLAEKGSRNHLLLLDLQKKGAKLAGTEDIELLMREYNLLNVLLMKEPGAEQAAAMPQYHAKSAELLKARDEFIFNRIKSTLREGEAPLVFMGVMHRLDKLLEKDYLISQVIYRLPFGSAGAIYNV